MAKEVIDYDGESIERYRLQTSSPITLEEVMAIYDGTFFHGINGVRVIFNDQGETQKVLSFNLLNPNLSSTAYIEHPDQKGLWYPDNSHNIYAAPLVSSWGEGKSLMAIIEVTKKEWEEWKATESKHPGVDFRTWKKSKTN